MDAEPGFFISYYQKELGKAGYLLSEVHQAGNTLQFAFDSAPGVSGSVFTESNSEDHPGTDYAVLIVNIPPIFKNHQSP